MQKEIERRSFAADELRVDDGEKRLIGHAAVFNSIADLGFFREQIAPGAFAESINEDDVRALFNHDPNQVLGRNKSGTLKMREDAKGLAVDIQPPDTQNARDVMELIRRGDVSQMSFAFRTLEESWDMTDRAMPTRTLTKVQLFDVSPVTYPAYAATDVSVVRSFLDRLPESEAKSITKGMWKEPSTHFRLLRHRYEILEAECRFASAL